MNALRHKLANNSSKRRYELIRVIGRGGFGTVYLARLVGPGGFEKLVAVKILNQESDEHPELASRLRDEARILGLVRNQAIVQVDGLLQVQGRWAVVMEYVDGLDLYGILRRLPLPPRPALEMIGALATALDVAWNALSPEGEPLHLIHRDVKPSNIKVTIAGEVKILDFGIARAEFEAREAKTSLEGFGTPVYMAPERLELRDGPEGDVYALGVVLFECLTRRVLYEKRCFRKEELHTDRVIQAQDLAWHATGQVSEELIHFMGEMLAFRPEARPAAHEVAARCDALVDELKGARLRAWARASLPPIVEALSGPVDDSMTGAVLVEEAESTSDVQGAMSLPTPVAVFRPPDRPARPRPPTPGVAQPAAQVSSPKTEVNPNAAGPTRPRRPRAPRERERRAQARPGCLMMVAVVATAIACGIVAWRLTGYLASMVRDQQGELPAGEGPILPTPAPVDPKPAPLVVASSVTGAVPQPGAASEADPTAASVGASPPGGEGATAPEPAAPSAAPSPASAAPPSTRRSGRPSGRSEPASDAQAAVAFTAVEPEAPPPPPPKLYKVTLADEDLYAEVRLGDKVVRLPQSLPAGDYTVNVFKRSGRSHSTLTVKLPTASGSANIRCYLLNCKVE